VGGGQLLMGGKKDRFGKASSDKAWRRKGWESKKRRGKGRDFVLETFWCKTHGTQMGPVKKHGFSEILGEIDVRGNG